MNDDARQVREDPYVGYIHFVSLLFMIYACKVSFEGPVLIYYYTLLYLLYKESKPSTEFLILLTFFKIYQLYLISLSTAVPSLHTVRI